jgi:hypothetical protein
MQHDPALEHKDDARSGFGGGRGQLLFDVGKHFERRGKGAKGDEKDGNEGLLGALGVEHDMHQFALSGSKNTALQRTKNIKKKNTNKQEKGQNKP